jgi:2-dehydro-3-deoxygluconokinase
MVSRDGRSHAAPVYDLRGIVDRIGTGDAFAAGILHGLLSGMPVSETVHFGLAAACLKHSIPGDFSLVERADVEDLIAQAGFGVRR